jgi:hypothetical protein
MAQALQSFDCKEPGVAPHKVIYRPESVTVYRLSRSVRRTGPVAVTLTCDQGHTYKYWVEERATSGEATAPVAPSGTPDIAGTALATPAVNPGVPPLVPAVSACKPKVDDQFWFDLSVELVGKSQSRQEETASKFQALVLWLWGVYTSYAALGPALAAKALPTWVIAMTAVASASLIAVYWATVWVQSPVAASFDPRSAEDIRASLDDVLVVRQRRLNWTTAASVAAAALVSLAVVLISTVKEEKPVGPSLDAVLIQSSSGKAVALSAQVNAKGECRISLRPEAPGRKAAPIDRLVLPTSSGLIQTGFDLDPDVTDVSVSMQWTGPDGLIWSLSRALHLIVSK